MDESHLHFTKPFAAESHDGLCDSFSVAPLGYFIWPSLASKWPWHYTVDTFGRNPDSPRNTVEGRTTVNRIQYFSNLWKGLLAFSLECYKERDLVVFQSSKEPEWLIGGLVRMLMSEYSPVSFVWCPHSSGLASPQPSNVYLIFPTCTCYCWNWPINQVSKHVIAITGYFLFKEYKGILLLFHQQCFFLFFGCAMFVDGLVQLIIFLSHSDHIILSGSGSTETIATEPQFPVS